MFIQKRVQERLGHSSIKITMDVYSHVLPSMQDDVARMLGEMFKEKY
jgi:integrase